MKFDLEALKERAAIVEYDGGVPRTTACRLAATFALQACDSGISEQAARWIFQNAAAILEWERTTRSSREQTFEAMDYCFETCRRANATPRRKAG